MVSAKHISLGLFVLMCLMFGSSLRVLQDSKTTEFSKNIDAHFHQEQAANFGGKNNYGNDDGGNNIDAMRSDDAAEGAPYRSGQAERVNMDGIQDHHADIEPYGPYEIGVSKEEQLGHGKQDHYAGSKPCSSYGIDYSKVEHYDKVEIIHAHEKQHYHPSVSELDRPALIDTVNEPEPPGMDTESRISNQYIE